MHSHELIVEENNPIIKDYSYSEVESNGIKVFVRSICKKDNINAFLEVLKKYYDYSLEFVDTNAHFISVFLIYSEALKYHIAT